MNIPSHIFETPATDAPPSLDDVAADIFAEEDEDLESPEEGAGPDFARLVPSVFEQMRVELNTPPSGDPALAIAGYAKELGIKGEAEFFNWLIGVVRSAKENGRPWQGGASIAAYLRELRLATDTYHGRA